MKTIPYDGFNPLQNLSAFLVNADIVQDPALAFITAVTVSIFGVLILVAAVTHVLEKKFK